MKRILFTLLIFSTFSVVRAQSSKHSLTTNHAGLNNKSGLKLELSINPALSIGRFGSEFVLGGEISLSRNFTPDMEGALSAGYTKFFYGHNNELIPVKAGMRYFLIPKIYLGAQAGVAFSPTDGGAYFIYSPTVGWKINNQFDISLKYDHFSNEPSVLGFNLTYKIGL
ncbi:hypothetical protein GJU39_21675 [Pedobacter petrophilus]|uniref:Outer membrane beta-barrel protein n=1 Tax=Pedobacter petrophilus TaxID=1908241 RepID=A0A7K0G4G3_9SPHI|nr:hypothetical protein [Pedobacter petrophilus]MRX78693.1 hypothetical protein [Pedobacter petrophilus]